jgi:hypothetical protein
MTRLNEVPNNVRLVSMCNGCREMPPVIARTSTETRLLLVSDPVTPATVQSLVKFAMGIYIWAAALSHTNVFATGLAAPVVVLLEFPVGADVARQLYDAGLPHVYTGPGVSVCTRQPVRDTGPAIVGGNVPTGAVITRLFLADPYMQIAHVVAVDATRNIAVAFDAEVR